MKKLILPFLFLFLLSYGNLSAQCNAAFVWAPIGTGLPTIIFIDNSSGSGIISSYNWDFGDGTNDFTQNPMHTYSTPGNYMVCLSISDNLGCTDTICQMVSAQINVVAVAIGPDSLTMFNCTSPATVNLSVAAFISGYLPNDSARFDINFGDGHDSTYYVSLADSFLSSYFTHTYLNPGTYIPQLIITAPDLQGDTSVSNSPIYVYSTCGSISGTVYIDVNSNCTYDNGEELQDIAVSLFSGGNYIISTYSDVNGDYSFNFPPGTTYDLQISSNNGFNGHFNSTCPPTGHISVNTVPSAGNNFGLICPPGFDLQGNITGWRFRPGTTTSVCVSVFDQRCDHPDSGSIELTFTPNVTPLPDTAGIGYTVNNQTVTYPLDSFLVATSFCIPVAISPNAQVGDSICIDMSILPIADDSVPSNNSGTFCFPIVNSYDPNDKYVVPAGDGPTGVIDFNTDLTYTIRFQNTGNAEAINIFILDTIDTDLDLSSVEIIGTSHQVIMNVLNGNILRFSFDNIMLADSNSNEPASHGYVTYRIKQKTNLPQLTVINNTAGIYFDFNPAVITNTTTNTVDFLFSVPTIGSKLMKAYPNPANGKCYLLFSDNRSRTIAVTDAFGKEILRTMVSGDFFTMNISQFRDGIYLIRIVEEGNNAAMKLVIVH